MTTNVMVRDLDLGVMNVQDALEVIADGLPLYGGAQLAVDTTIVSALHCDGTLPRGGRWLSERFVSAQSVHLCV